MRCECNFPTNPMDFDKIGQECLFLISFLTVTRELTSLNTQSKPALHKSCIIPGNYLLIWYVWQSLKGSFPLKPKLNWTKQVFIYRNISDSSNSIQSFIKRFDIIILNIYCQHANRHSIMNIHTDRVRNPSCFVRLRTMQTVWSFLI